MGGSIKLNSVGTQDHDGEGKQGVARAQRGHRRSYEGERQCDEEDSAAQGETEGTDNTK